VEVALDVPLGGVALGIEPLGLGAATGGGELIFVAGAFVLMSFPVPLLYWSLVPPWLQPARATTAPSMISVLFIVFSLVGLSFFQNVTPTSKRITARTMG